MPCCLARVTTTAAPACNRRWSLAGAAPPPAPRCAPKAAHSPTAFPQTHTWALTHPRPAAAAAARPAEGAALRRQLASTTAAAGPSPPLCWRRWGQPALWRTLAGSAFTTTSLRQEPTLCLKEQCWLAVRWRAWMVCMLERPVWNKLPEESSSICTTSPLQVERVVSATAHAVASRLPGRRHAYPWAGAFLLLGWAGAKSSRAACVLVHQTSCDDVFYMLAATFSLPLECRRPALPRAGGRFHGAPPRPHAWQLHSSAGHGATPGCPGAALRLRDVVV